MAGRKMTTWNAMNAVIAMDEVKKRFLSDGIEAEYMGPADFGAFLEEEQASWTRIVKKANIKLD